MIMNYILTKITHFLDKQEKSASFLGTRYTVAEWFGAGLAISRSWVRIPPTAAVYQRQLSVPSLRGRLMSTSGSWE